MLAADAFPTALAPALRSLACERGEEGALQVDVFKLNHHGCRANVTQDLLAAVQADYYIVSTNGAVFQHPNEEAIARVILHGGSRPKILFNYANERTQRWADSALLERYGYQVGVLSDTVGGIVLELDAARKPASRPRSESHG